MNQPCTNVGKYQGPQATQVGALATSSQVAHQHEMLAKCAERNESLCREVETRLSPALRQEQECPRDVKDVPREYLVPLADTLRDIHDRLIRNNAVLESILGRCEL